MKELNITVLFVDTIPARIYLAILNKYGYKPKKIIYLNQESEGRKFKIIKRLLGLKIANLSRGLFKKLKHKPLKEIDHKLLRLNKLKKSDLDVCLDHFHKNSIERIRVSSIHDHKLVTHIQTLGEVTILFTGGGILKSDLLDIPTAKFIHIHPGVVPDIRGADCFFWSYLLRGKAGYSAFYMNSGIDTGDIITKKEYILDLKGIELVKYNNHEIYDSLLMYLDPCLRIKTFIDLLDASYESQKKSVANINLFTLPYEKQNPKEGRMYFFMHENIRDFVINTLKRNSE